MTRNGGDLVVETLTALGASTVFGIPGQHALGLFDALRRSPLRFVGARVENNAAFAADGFARTGGVPAVLFLSTGPGALTALAGLQEARATGVPIVVVVSQVPRAGLGGLRTGHLHQLDDQQASAANVVKSTRLVHQPSQIPAAIEAAWREAVTAPQGPVWVEVPQDVLLEPTSLPVITDVRADPAPVPPARHLVAAAAEALDRAVRPVILAGGGVRRAGAQAEVRALAEALRAPVVTTPGGQGAFPHDHDLSAGSWVEDVLTTRLLEDADVLLVVGSALGEVTSNYFTMRPRGQIVQIDAEPRVLESRHPALGIHADARAGLAALVEAVTVRAPDGRAETTVRELRAAIGARLDEQGLELERSFLAAVRAAVPDAASTFWDMTIAAYWAWSCWDSRGGQFHSAQGSGGLGWALGAALGGAAAGAERVLAVSGDGGAMYSLAELATARQHNLPVTWLIIDDGGYGILREYMADVFGAATATELDGPDLVAVAEAFGVPATLTTPAEVGQALTRAWASSGPNVVLVRRRLRMFAPTHTSASA